jgi:hypothetical protein
MVWFFGIVFYFSHIYILFKFSFYRLFIWKKDFSETMLHSLIPIPFIYWSVNPIHFSITMFFIFKILSYIIIPSFPIKLPLTMFFIIHILSLILIWFRIFFFFLPFTFTVFHSLFEFTCIYSSSFPSILSVTIWFSFLIHTYKDILIGKNISTLSLF